MIQPATNAALTRNLSMVVAGAAGGVGATTVAALLAAALTARTGLPPKITDHTGGAIADRVTTASPTATHSVHDAGPHAANIAGLTAAPDACPVIVAATTADSADTALFALQRFTATPGGKQDDPTRPQRGVIVINSTSPRKPPHDTSAHLNRIAPGAVVIALPWDPALALPGPVDPATTNPRTAQSVAQILQAFGV
ncbi:MAG: hypothetical protein LBH76_08635 [Propionibacteriaceae bacterium]|jgi:MinD-like ATPase involved in chromosome partitioning or flagellar assembly|nr:hypothetical protein [Propionibacteriaceae bacterium]